MVTQYLRLLDDNGNLVPRALSMLLMASRYNNIAEIEEAYVDEGNDSTIYDFYKQGGKVLVTPKKPYAKSSAGPFKDMVQKRRTVDRQLTAETVFQLWACSLVSTKRPIRLGDARERAAFCNREYRRICERARQRPGEALKIAPYSESVIGQVERAYSYFRDVAHFVFIGVMWDSEFRSPDCPKRPIEEWIGMARTMEAFLDECLILPSQKWCPIRVPTAFAPMPLPTPDLDEFRRILALRRFKK